MEGKGLIHVYYGYGKGKTTCALGLAVRASGRGLKVVIVQFLKDMKTGELKQFEKMDGVTVIRGTASPVFVKDMTPEQIDETRRLHNEHLREAMDMVDAGECDLLILDEVLDAYQHDVLDDDMFHEIVCNKPEGLELVITGHKKTENTQWVFDEADYITEMRKERHPFDKGIRARKGIEL